MMSGIHCFVCNHSGHHWDVESIKLLSQSDNIHINVFRDVLDIRRVCQNVLE